MACTSSLEALQLRIKALGLLIEAAMLDWERAGDFGARGEADRHRIEMEKLIRQRNEALLGKVRTQQ